MAAIENRLFKETDQQYHKGVAIDNYNGKISLVSADTGTDGNIYAQWVYGQKRENGQNVPGDRTFPMKVLIGSSKQEALETLQFFMDLINGKSNAQQPMERQNNGGNYQPPQTYDDIPF